MNYLSKIVANSSRTLRKDNYSKTLPVGKFVKILALLSQYEICFIIMFLQVVIPPIPVYTAILLNNLQQFKCTQANKESILMQFGKKVTGEMYSVVKGGYQKVLACFMGQVGL